MTKEFCKIMLLAGTILCSGISTVNAQTCTVAPTCESLGYTMSAANCTGKKTLKCPFDINKLYCVTEAGLANVNLGDVMFSDRTTGPLNVIQPDKTAIGIVIDKTADSVVIATNSGPDKLASYDPFDHKITFQWNGKIPNNSNKYEITNIDSWTTNNGVDGYVLLPAYNGLKEIYNSTDGRSVYNTLVKWMTWKPSGTIADMGAQTIRESGSLYNSTSSDFTVIPLNPRDFQDCNTYKTEGTSTGDWYRPTIEDLKNLPTVIAKVASYSQNVYKDIIGFKLYGDDNVYTTINFDLPQSPRYMPVKINMYYYDGETQDYTTNEYSIPYYRIAFKLMKISSRGKSEITYSKKYTNNKICITKIKI